MRNDEFNKIEITNEKQTSGFEFGKTQKLEVTFQKDNKLPDGELNEKYIGKTIRKHTEANIQYENKAMAPTHGSTTVTSATTASNVAATTATVVTAASVVAVTAVAVGTGISVALHNYDYRFNSFKVTSDALYYELLVVDLNDEKRADGESYEEYDRPNEEDREDESKAPFTLRVYNEYYDYSVPTYYDSNWGEFTSLKPEQQYHIVLSENRFGGETIFDEQFTTLKEETRVSEFRGISWDKTCNFLTMMMNVKLDYQDDYDRFSDFKFNLKSEVMTADAPNEISYDLVKTTEEQQIKLDNNQSFNLVETYEYTFTYMDEGVEVTAESGSVHFEDNSGAESKFNQFIFDKTANFINRTFDVQLDFVDDFNVYDNFVLSMFRTYEQEGMTIIDDMSVDIPLQKTAEVQTVDLDGYEVMLSDSYHYKLTCNYYNEPKVLDEGNVTFTDTSGAVTEFRELIFDKKANFDTRTFEVQLDYTNDLGYLYGFQMTLTDLTTSEERTYYLQETTDVQTITVDEIQEYIDENPVYYIDIVEHRMSYSFKYMNQDQEVVVVPGEEFKFKNSLVSTFQGIDTSYDFIADLTDGPFHLPMRFLYDDAAHVYQSFSVKVFADEQEVGYFMFEGETVKHDWMYATLYGNNGYSLNPNDLSGSNVQIKVTASMLNVDAEESGGPDVIEEDVYTQDNVTFTLNQNQNIYGVNIMSDTIYAGDYQIGMMPIYSGDSDAYSVYFIFECETGKKYTCPFSMPTMGNYSYVPLMECEEGFDDTAFWEDFENPVKISIKFAKVQDGITPSESDYTTMVVSESYKFNLSA
jgi:hypothetical protein